MNIQYLLKELYYRRRRTLTAVFSLAVGLAILITINALSMAYNEAARIPLKEIGANITVQRAGNVPEELTGPVFACSAVTIKNDEIKQIQQLPGVDGFAQALLLWVFDKDRFTMKGNAAQTTVGAAATPIDVHGVPVDDLGDFLIDRVDQENATVTFTLLATPNYRGRDEFCHGLQYSRSPQAGGDHQSKFFLNVSSNSLGRL